ncbi:helicase-related protein [Thermoactinospora rubra]|uniref:DEAD/DEAH box helicase n=1 Tax=Thermoactinospora rubra TaxID=1088767 RepID=UPI001301B8D2|nr:helicase-related protein [Thermoactinospora rubra]
MSDDLLYRPSTTDLRWLEPLNLATCLVIGAVPDGSRDRFKALAQEVRGMPASLVTRLLHRGTYAVEIDEDWHAVVVLDGVTSEPAGAERRSMDSGHLIAAWAVQQEMWKQAQPLGDDARYRVGDLVKPDGGSVVGNVIKVVPSGFGYRYEVEIRGKKRRYTEQSLQGVAGDPDDMEFWLAQEPAGADDVALTLTWTKLTHPLTDTIYSFASSKTVFRAYQFKPVLKILTGSSGRILIADEVGLGKTIEAGLIWSELEQRRKLDRVLVIAPSVLKYKWQAEMRRRFDRNLDLLRPRDLDEWLDRVEDGDDPTLHAIVSIESLRKADKVLTRLSALQPRFDLVIIDEAHSMRNRESKANALGQHLSDNSDYLVLLSATPLNLGNDDLFNLVNLLDEGNFNDRDTFAMQLEPNAVLNKVSSALVGNQHPRELLAELDRLDGLRFGRNITDRPDYHVLRTLLDADRPLTHQEKARARQLLADLNVLSGVLTRTRKADVPDRKAVREPRNIDVEWTAEERAYYDAVYRWAWLRAWSKGVPPGFIMQMPLRQAASCIPASQEVMRRREPYLFDDVDDLDEVDDELEAEDLGPLREHLAKIRPVQRDTKFERLLEELLRLREHGIDQAMIFSFFRGTLSYLQRRLSEHFTCRVMHGGVPLIERQDIMRDFRDGKFEILLLSEVGSEGLDFEFCQVLVNYDLPWNPMRVEQRIGRLDRFGQQHEKIFIYNMRVPGTIETDIFQRLYDRIGIFHNAIGELEPILRDSFAKLLDPSLTPQQRDRELERIAVATEGRALDTDELNASRSLLAGLDSLLVEGFTENGPGNGRFVGAAEIRGMIDRLFQKYGGRWAKTDNHGVHQIIGTPELATRLRESHSDSTSSTYPRYKLAARLQERSPVECTFDPEVASKLDVDLLSARHPLVKLAIEVLGEDNLALQRFGSVAVPGLPEGRRYLMTIDLAESDGLRPRLELWTTAVDVETGEPSEGAGDALLTALAEGALQDGDTSVPGNLLDLWHRAQELVAARQSKTELILKQENAALVDGRIRAQENTIDLQIRNVEERLAKQTNPSIRRMHEGRLRNLRAARERVREELSPRRALSLWLTSVAVLLVNALATVEPTPSGGSPSQAHGRAPEKGLLA